MNETDDSGFFKHGYWEEYTKDGKIIINKGHYIHGVKNGCWTNYYYNSKQKTWEGFYRNGIPTGYWEYYSLNGKVRIKEFNL